MARNYPSLDLLEGFEAAARHLSFTKAGEELFLTQSAVSRQIKDLEDQLGAALFHRRHRALTLTEAGQQFYAATAQVLTTMRAATSRLRAQSGRKTLSLTTTNSFAALWLIPRLAGFTRTHPDVEVKITAETRVQDLERDGLDIDAVMRKRLTVTGSTLRPRSAEFKGYLAKNLREKIWPLVEAGRIRPQVYKTFPLEAAAEAHRLMESSQHIGKIVLTF